MVDPIQTVTEYPDNYGSPIRSQRDNYDINMDNFLRFFLSFLPEFRTSISGMNNLIPQVKAAANAASLSNFVGLYSSLTGALNVPASAYHLNQIWTLTESVEDVTLEVPGTSAKWVIPNNPRAGVDTTSSAVDVTLTYASKTIQYLSMTTAEKFVILPDTAVLQDGDFFDFFNDGSYRYGIKNSTGTFIASINAKGYGRLTRVGSSWKASNGADLLMARLKTVINGAATGDITACPLTDTTVFVAFSDTANYKGKAQVLTWVPGTPAITESNELEFSATAVSYLSSCKMMDTVPILAYTDADSDGQVAAFTYTPGTNTLALTDTHEYKDGATIAHTAVVPIYQHATEGKICVVYFNSLADTARIYSQVLNWTGTEITPNTAENSCDLGNSSAYYSADVIAGTISTATIAVSLYRIASSDAYLIRILWTGGNTLALSNVSSLGSGGDYSSTKALNENYFTVAYTSYGSSNYEVNVALFDINFARKKTLHIAHGLVSKYMSQKSLGLLDSETLLLSIDPVARYQSNIYKIKAIGASASADCVFEIESEVSIGILGTSGGYKNLIPLDGAGALYVHQGSSGYVNVDRIEVG